MKLVVFGLSVSSSWGNGHATLWRGLIRALGDAGHDVVFFEWDAPYHAPHRERVELPGCRVELYTTWESIRPRAERELADCDVGIVTSYCPDGVRAARLVLDSRAPRRVFYDLDTPVTLERLRRGEVVGYLPAEGLGGFDLVLSFTGGLALDELRARLGARAVAPLYGSVDPAVQRRAPVTEAFRCDLSYLGTYASDRRQALERLLLDAARGAPERSFLVAGGMYPDGIAWPENVAKREHVPPHEHAAFYCSSGLTLNLTRSAMTKLGYCPSGRLFAAAACGTPVLSDAWVGLDHFFEPGTEILVTRSAQDTRAALALDRAELRRIGRAARARALEQHTATARARELLALVEKSAIELHTGEPGVRA